jgi:hypothetical protein
MRPAPLLLSLAVLATAPIAHADLAAAPLREILSQADVRACIAPHALPVGRYVMRLTVGATGTPSGIEMTESPASLSPAGTACVVAAFARLRFPSMQRAATVEPRPMVHGRRARVPTSHTGPSDSQVQITWPFVISAP